MSRKQPTTGTEPGRARAGRAGGKMTLKRKGRAFYAEIGRKGGMAGTKKSSPKAA